MLFCQDNKEFLESLFQQDRSLIELRHAEGFTVNEEYTNFSKLDMEGARKVAQYLWKKFHVNPTS